MEPTPIMQNNVLWLYGSNQINSRLLFRVIFHTHLESLVGRALQQHPFRRNVSRVYAIH